MSEINVTPFVDVMLVLLVIFMVSAPLMTTGVSVDLPQAEAPQMDLDDEMTLLSVAINPACEQPDAPSPCTAQPVVFIGEEPIEVSDIEARLAGDEQVQEDGEVFVRADEAVPYGVVVRVFAAIRRAGVEKLGLVTDPLSSD
jgi:biopolymer transport protein TolR